jgi:hypothetical protein
MCCVSVSHCSCLRSLNVLWMWGLVPHSVSKAHQGLQKEKNEWRVEENPKKPLKMTSKGQVRWQAGNRT